MASLYFLENRPVERIFAFGLTMAAVFWFVVNHRSVFSEASLTGLLYGVCLCFLIRMLGVSAMSEGTLWMIITVVIGIKYGIKAAGISVLGWVLMSLAMALAIVIVNGILSRKRGAHEASADNLKGDEL
jgi:hypothetical protein